MRRQAANNFLPFTFISPLPTTDRIESVNRLKGQVYLKPIDIEQS